MWSYCISWTFCQNEHQKAEHQAFNHELKVYQMNTKFTILKSKFIILKLNELVRLSFKKMRVLACELHKYLRQGTCLYTPFITFISTFTQ